MSWGFTNRTGVGAGAPVSGAAQRLNSNSHANKKTRDKNSRPGNGKGSKDPKGPKK